MPRYKSTEQAPAGRRVVVQRNGRLHEATYSVNGSIVVVDSVMLGSKRGWRADMTPEGVARMLLTELLEEHEMRQAINDTDWE